MLFEPYTRARMLQRLDADFAAACGSPAGFALAWIRDRIGFGRVLALGGCMVLLSASLATAQANRPAPAASTKSPAKTSTAKPQISHAAHHRRHAKPAAAKVAPAPVAPPPPVPPAEQPANAATVNFKNGLLTVHAQNSSLIGILNLVQHQTGLVVDGLNHDQRIYGQYGPGNISTTLSALLDGSGYDFVIVGNGSNRTPPRLILSPPGAVGAAATPQPPPAAVTNQDQQNDTEAPPPVNNEGDAPQSEDDQGGPADPTLPPQPKTPQQIFNEMRRMHPQ
jgi:hypothetical protein